MQEKFFFFVRRSFSIIHFVKKEYLSIVEAFILDLKLIRHGDCTYYITWLFVKNLGNVGWRYDQACWCWPKTVAANIISWSSRVAITSDRSYFPDENVQFVGSSSLWWQTSPGQMSSVLANSWYNHWAVTQRRSLRQSLHFVLLYWTSLLLVTFCFK